MGGYGSGKWERWDKKVTVEDSWSLDINWMIREGLFDQRGERRGLIQMIDPSYGGMASSVRYELSVPQRSMRLKYLIKEDSQAFDLRVKLTTTDLPRGGIRWWFHCPLTCRGHYCGRRVAKLYMAQSPYFGCRHCHNLTYRSCQESHQYDRMWRSVNCSTAREMLEFEDDARDDERFFKMLERREQLRRRHRLGPA
jgi:hypothetical protein